MNWLREAKKWTEKEQDALCEEAKAKFGKDFWCKPGHEWGQNAIFWTGESAIMADGLEAYDTYAMDPKETIYVMGIHKDLIKWAESKKIFLEPYDAGTLIGYPA